MNAHASPPGAGVVRDVHALVEFARSGERTFIHRQEVPYPFHVTRPFVLDAGCPQLSTLYLQSASGGLYRGDRLRLRIAARPGAMAHVTTQAATVVHDGSGGGTVQRTRVEVADGAFLALTVDPLVLFPGADLLSTTELALAGCDARAIIADGFAVHDPAGASEPFRRLATRARVTGPAGQLLCADAGDITGEEFCGRSSPLGPYRAVGTVMMLGGYAVAVDAGDLERQLERLGCLAGASALPNGCGSFVRLLAPDGGTLARGLDAAVAIAIEAALGIVPARRRK